MAAKNIQMKNVLLAAGLMVSLSALFACSSHNIEVTPEPRPATEEVISSIQLPSEEPLLKSESIKNLAAPEVPEDIRNEYSEIYDGLIKEWKSEWKNDMNNIDTDKELFSFRFYTYTGFTEIYYALYDIDKNGVYELLLKKHNGYEDIIAYIFTVKDGLAVNLFGYDEEQLPREVPWSRVGWASILDIGLIDCSHGDYTIYKIDGYSAVEFASIEPYDYPDEANKAMAKWRQYINGVEVDEEFYIQALEEKGYVFSDVLGGANVPANIFWEHIE